MPDDSRRTHITIDSVATAAGNKTLVRDAFMPWEQGDSAPFFALIDEDVRWTVIGTTVASGDFDSKQAVIDEAFGPLLERLDGPLTARFIEVAADGDRVFLRFESTGVSTSGVRYDQAYCWAMTMRDGRITEIVAYLDTDLLARVMA
jgi:ketosteroid isomerase-like protein